jgi:hypothetical protein
LNTTPDPIYFPISLTIFPLSIFNTIYATNLMFLGINRKQSPL